MIQQYFARIDGNNMCIDVAVVSIDYMANNPNLYPGRWVETFFDTPGKQYAGVGFEYLEDEQDFRSPQPFPSWTWLNKTWNPPTPMPDDGEIYRWSEEDLEWVAI
jgi:hypothetical protein